MNTRSRQQEVDKAPPISAMRQDVGLMDPELRERIGGRADLADVAPYRVPQLDAPVKLNTNESPYPPPEAFIVDLKARIDRIRFNRYPERDFPLVREALARHIGTLSDRIWVANGSNEIYLQLLLTFGGAERKAMTFEPTYGMHSQIIRISGTRMLRGRRNPDFSLQLEATLEAIDVQRPDIVFLCSPNNPTGNTHTEEEIAAVCARAPGIVLLDEAYAEFSGTTYARLIEDFDHLVVTRSFSKAWRLAGARIGYLLAQPWVIEELQKVRLPYHLSALTQAVALTAVDHAGELLSTVETIRHERDRLWTELSTTRSITAFPSQANFILFRTQERPATQVWQGLLDKGILVRDFSDVQGLEDCLRVSVGTPDEDEKFLESLSEQLVR
ncbi:MAG: histidinol-phosphate transaminase [Actinomycetota bacterium]